MLLAKAEWGTIPDWVTAFGTLAAFAAALVLLRKELAAHRGYEEDRRRAQARLVAAWIATRSSDSGLRSYVVMKNGSEEPVYDGLATVLVMPNPSTSDLETTFEQDTPEHAIWHIRWLVLPPQERKEGVLGCVSEVMAIR